MLSSLSTDRRTDKRDRTHHLHPLAEVKIKSFHLEQRFSFRLFIPDPEKRTFTADSRTNTALPSLRYSADRMHTSIRLLLRARTTSLVYAARQRDTTETFRETRRSTHSTQSPLTSPWKDVPFQQTHSVPPLVLQNLGEQNLYWTRAGLGQISRFGNGIRTFSLAWRLTAPDVRQKHIKCFFLW